VKEELTERGVLPFTVKRWVVSFISFSNNSFPTRYEVPMPSSESSVDVRPGNSKSLLLTSSEVLEALLVV
jgi:hypothetical protein